MSPDRSIIKRIPTLLFLAGMTSGGIVAFGIAVPPKIQKQARQVVNVLLERLPIPYAIDVYVKTWTGIQKKVNDLRTAQEDKERLRQENLFLKLDLETLRFSCNSREGINSTQKNQLQLSKETGARMGRTLASIRYRPPHDIPAAQLYTMGVAYFKARENEKAAIIFTMLTGMEGNESYKAAKDYMLAGVSWYRLDNFKLADSYFDQILKKTTNADSLAYKARARLWKALVAQKLNQKVRAQFWLKDLLDHHPHSAEAKWINKIEAKRGTASHE